MWAAVWAAVCSGWRALGRALFLDVPYLIDSRWRHIEYALCAESNYEPGQHARPERRAFVRKPPFWLFAITAFYVTYGPTRGGLCGILPAPTPSALVGWSWVVIGVSVVLGIWILVTELGAIEARIDRAQTDDTERGWPAASPGVRKVVTGLLLAGAVWLLIRLGIAAGDYIASGGDLDCAVSGGNPGAWPELVAYLVAVAVFAAVGGLARRWPGLVVWVQAIILGALAAYVWYGLATDDAREAWKVPYRHVFAFWAPCIVATLIFAPLLACFVFKYVNRADAPTMRNRFGALLRQTELFVNRKDPELSVTRVLYALVYGPTERPLLLLLLPALVALAAPGELLYVLVAAAFAASVLLLAWGNISSRWQEPIIYLQRWFLRGGPLFITLFVIVVAVLRVLQVEYISTLLDAIPLGTIFSLVVMTYALFWLTEYWMSRVVATHLLSLLGPPAENVSVAYDFPAPPAPPVPPVPPAEPPPPDPDRIKVSRQRRFVVSHGTGRFVAVGTLAELDAPLVEDRVPPYGRAFQPYYLIDLFSRLSERTGDPHDHEKVSRIAQLTAVYFLVLNLAMLAVTGAFVGVFWRDHYVRNNGIEPVVTAASATPGDLVNLAKMLDTDRSARPAIVVVGSGGGTRAALYSASVLHGLHCLGIDRDIVLLSGVSGGGVGLSYFAANRDALTAAQTGACARAPSPAWKKFTQDVTAPFIEDVLDGATEWRIFGTTALSVLLAESFDRRLVGFNRKLGSLAAGDAPGLILNTTMVAHPAEESQALASTLVPPGGACDEAERAFNLMSGGRLVFTNLSDVSKFPQRTSVVPDVRLPYRIVQAADVPLAAAAALNANFPPVFPNARVRITGTEQPPCPDRSYYVTDGGAEENLGLVSALYALRSALAAVPEGHVRPIHVVIAEASAEAYDYSDDRGFSVMFGSSRERLTGGLTEALLGEVNGRLTDLKAAPLRTHYLGLPLAFRARGGFGTHWLYAKEFHLNDPRPRTSSWLAKLVPWAAVRSGQAVIDRTAMEKLWTALHDPDPGKGFCDSPVADDDATRQTNMRKVQTWICGSGGADQWHDLHMANWNAFVQEMRKPTP